MEEKQLLKSMGKLEWKLRKKLRAMKKKGQAGTDEYNTLRWVTRCIGGILGNYERNYGKSTGREQGSQEQAGREQGSDGDAPCSRDGKPVNRECEFYDDEGGCMIGSDIMFCGRYCSFASNNPLATPPYGTKYMRGGRL